MNNHLKRLIVAANFIFFAINAFAQVKLPDNVLISLNAGHPRLLVKSMADFNELKSRITKDDFLQQCLSHLLAEADSIINEPVCTYEIPDGLRLLVVSRKVLNRSYVLSMAYRLTANKNLHRPVV